MVPGGVQALAKKKGKVSQAWVQGEGGKRRKGFVSEYCICRQEIKAGEEGAAEKGGGSKRCRGIM